MGVMKRRSQMNEAEKCLIQKEFEDRKKNGEDVILVCDNLSTWFARVGGYEIAQKGGE